MTTICKNCGIKGQGVHHCDDSPDEFDLVEHLRERILYLEDIIINTTKKRPSTALDFMDAKASEIIQRRKQSGK